MIMSPMIYKEMHLNDSYEELIKERNWLIRQVKYFEKNKEKLMNEYLVCPTPDVVYKFNLEYLVIICALISQKFNEKYE